MLATNMSQVYRAVLLPDNQKDLHHFLWKEDPKQPVVDCRMTTLTFRVFALSFAVNMALRQNVLNFAVSYPQAA